MRIAVLDLNNQEENQGFQSILEIVHHFQQESMDAVEIESFDVRAENEFPDFHSFDVFISSGGPGSPLPIGEAWEARYFQWLNQLMDYNRYHDQKKFAFLICHSFQLACIEWKLGHVGKRPTYSFGVLRVNKTAEANTDVVFGDLSNPFYAVDSRAYEIYLNSDEEIAESKFDIMATEFQKGEPRHTVLMAARFSKEIYGTQFHPEAWPEGFLKAVEKTERKKQIIESYGEAYYEKMLNHINDPDKLAATYHCILPNFLQMAHQELCALQAH